MDDLLEEFVAETRETLEILSGQLVEWEKNPGDLTLIDNVFRFVHTVKGSCGFLDLPRLAKMSHAAEDVLSAARDGKLVPSTELVSAVLAVVDHISDLANALETGSAVFDRDEELISAMVKHLEKAADENSPHLSNDAEKVSTETESVSSFQQHDLDESIQDNNRTVRVSLKVLDQLMSGISDLVLSRNEHSRQIRKAGDNLELEHSFSRLSAIVGEMRDSISMIRMQNIERLFSTLPRLVRDTSVELGKEIDLEISGGEVEVDREMVEALRDPLIHIIRNAVDHGIEPVDERIAAGKKPGGLIAISARQSGNQILVEIKDDGRGIDLEKLQERALSANLTTKAKWLEMSAQAKLSVIFEPGLSTANEVTAISGRGVGMDVVRSNLQKIGGTIELENLAGQGLSMTLRLPLTLTIIAGLSVRAGNQIFGVSRNSVEEILSLSNDNFEIEEVGGKQVAVIRGKRLPYARLEDLLELKTAKACGTRTAIVIKPAVGQRFVLDVESVVDHEEMVVKPGAPAVMQSGLYAGTSLPDSGKPMLLLDASGLASEIGTEQLAEASEFLETILEHAEDSSPKGESALLFTALSGRKQAARLSAIDRMEDIDVEQVTHVGGRLRAMIDGEMFDLFGMEEVPAEGQIQILRISVGNESKCLAISNVIDLFTLDGNMSDSADPKLYEGVVSAFGKPVELINIKQYFQSGHDGSTNDKSRALCFIPSENGNGWERHFLAPLLVSAGYRVTHDNDEADKAEIILGIDEYPPSTTDDDRIVQLSNHGLDSMLGEDILDKFDRDGLIAAIEQKLSGAA